MNFVMCRLVNWWISKLVNWLISKLVTNLQVPQVHSSTSLWSFFMYNIREIDVYNLSLEFSNTIWKICSKWESFSKNTIGYQLVRFADSISANIAEGFGRFHYKENIKFCFYARGSLEETQDWLRKAYKRKLIDSEKKKEIESFLSIFPPKLNAYINKIKQYQEQNNKKNRLIG